MSSIHKYYRFVVLVFIISSNLLHSKNDVIISKGRIEILISDHDFTYLKQHTELRDSLFSCANGALTELELHLSYKLSEPIRLAIFSSISEFKIHQQFKSSKFMGILLCGNVADINYQIRYNVASHFIEEYLMGLSVRERLERIKADRIPNWLKKGFIQYFAQGITYRDFELFRIWSKEGHFRNINFIPENEQEIFGSVIWYLFEKEKGRSIDGAFWMLIKNANSFEKSFTYQFDLRFNHWLKSKFEEINEQNQSKVQSDYAFAITSKNLTSIQVLQQRNSNNLNLYSLISNSENSELIGLGGLNHKIEKMGKFNNVCFNQNLVFTEPTFELKGSEKTVFYKMSWEHHVWKLFSDSQVIYIPNEQNGIWKLIYSTSEELILSHEIYDFTDIYTFSINDKNQSKVFRINRDKLTGWTQSDSIIYYLGTSSCWNHLSKQSYVAKATNNNSPKQLKIWESTDSRWLTDLYDIVIESNIHLSFVKSKETKSELIHLFKTQDQSFTKIATSIKGDFYGQLKLNPDSKRQAEYYFTGRHLKVNLNFSDEVILNSDSVIIKQYTFDSTQADIPPIKRVGSYLKESLFLSDFERESTINTLKHSPIIQKDDYKLTKYKNWFYAKNSIFYLSNKDIDLGYSRLIPTTALYNSPLTLFYTGNFYNNQGKEKLLLELFSNFNRRRIGFSAIYTADHARWNQSLTLMYRQRQYKAISTLNEREQTFQISHCYELKNKSYPLLTPFVVSRGQWISDVSMNYLPEISSDAISRSLLFEVEMGVRLNFKQWKYSPSFFQSNNELIFQNGTFSGQYISGLLFRSETKFKTRHFDFFNRFNGKYSITDANHLFILGGTKGWINANANTNIISENLESIYTGLVYSGGFVRGTRFGSRMGNSFISSQSEIHYKPLKLVKSYILGSSFWKQLTLFGFFDFATGFVGRNTRHYHNPYNTVVLDFPNYTIKAGANRNPWISSYGFGAQLRALGTDFRLEFPQSTVGDESPKSSILISLGKNF